MKKTNKPIAVIKIGGDVLLDPQEREGLGHNIKDLIDHQWDVVLLHGGGPQVNRLQDIHGLRPNKVGGRRITSQEDLLVVKQALVGEVNVDLVSLLKKNAVPAFGCHGASGDLIQAVKRPPRVISGAGDQAIDFGEVGDVEKINSKLIKELLNLKLVPVIATLGVGTQGQIYNINADTTVVQIARALSANILLMITQVGGIFQSLEDPDSRITEINKQQAKTLIKEGVIQGGMIPKIEEAISILDDGVETIAIVDAKTKGAFLSVTQNKKEIGTRIIP